MLNDYAFGGYLIFEHVRPFIDARVELYGDKMLSLYNRLQRGDSDAVHDTLNRYGIAWTIFPPDKRIVATLDREPGWRRLYSDATAVVHVRERAGGGRSERRLKGRKSRCAILRARLCFSMRWPHFYATSVSGRPPGYAGVAVGV